MNGYALYCVGILFFWYSIAIHAQDPTGVVRKNTREEVFQLDKLGVIHALVPNTGIKSVALFVAGDGGWNHGVADMAQLLANDGALVAGVDIVPYLTSLDNGDVACALVADDFEKLTRVVVERYALKDMPPPVLVGYSSGATLVYAILAQAPTGTFGGAISLGFCSTLEMQRPLCTGRNLALHHAAEGLALFPARGLDVPWFVLHGTADQACSIAEVSAFTKAIPTARLIPLPLVGHGYAVARRWQPQYVKAYKELTASHPARPNGTQ